jgi:hypothetical protein
MAIPVNNPGKVTRRIAKSKKKQNNKHLGSAASALEDNLEDNTATRTNSSLVTELMGASKISSPPKALSKVASSAKLKKANPELYERPKTFSTGENGVVVKPKINSDTPEITKMGGYESVDPTGAPKQTLLQKHDQLANRIRAGGKNNPGVLKQGRENVESAVKNIGEMVNKVMPSVSKATPPVSKPDAPKTAPNKASSKPPSKPPRPRPRLSPSAGAMEELGISPGGKNQPKASKKAPKKDKTEGGDYKSYSKDNNDFMYMTQQGYDKQEMEDMGGEKFGGRPGKGNLKTQGMNKTAKRKAGFSGKGSGAALRGF